MDLDERLRKARKQANLTQVQLAERSGVTQQMISKLETGRSKETADLVALAVACGVRAEWLAHEAGPMYQEQPAAAEAKGEGVYTVIGHGVHMEIDQEAFDIAVIWPRLPIGTRRLIQRQIFEEVGDMHPVLRRLWDNVRACDQERADNMLDEAQKRERANVQAKKDRAK